ncbi:hypothetical protein Hanom_Chr17g01586471 [Helianthus anomalus]
MFTSNCRRCPFGQKFTGGVLTFQNLARFVLYLFLYQPFLFPQFINLTNPSIHLYQKSSPSIPFHSSSSSSFFSHNIGILRSVGSMINFRSPEYKRYSFEGLVLCSKTQTLVKMNHLEY